MKTMLPSGANLNSCIQGYKKYRGFAHSHYISNGPANPSFSQHTSLVMAHNDQVTILFCRHLKDLVHNPPHANDDTLN